jgi:tetratricopeptide (TPR) repeat protein
MRYACRHARIAWSLLPAVLLAAAPAAGQHTASSTPIATLEQASRTLDAGRHRLAASQFRAIAGADPGSARAWFGLGKSYEALARESFQKLQTAAPESAWEALIVAEVLVSGGRFAQALSVYRDVQQAAPEIGGVHEAIADLYERAGKQEWAKAERAKAAAHRRDCAAHAAECAYLAASTSTSWRWLRTVPIRPRSSGPHAPTTRWPPRRLPRSTHCRPPPKCTSCSRRSIAIRDAPPRPLPNYERR